MKNILAKISVRLFVAAPAPFFAAGVLVFGVPNDAAPAFALPVLFFLPSSAAVTFDAIVCHRR